MKTISSIFVLFAIVAGLVAITPAAFADHSEVTITPAPGSGAPGCEETAEGCYIPKEATVDVGGKVIFSNTDTAAHTFTSGAATDETPGEVFNSSLVMAGSSYEWTPTTAGEVPYFCMVHPWMTGLIVVQEAGHEEGEQMEISVHFEDSEHVNYDIMVTQNGEEVLNDIGAHSHDGKGMHETAPLSSSDPVEITITFQGYGVDDPKTGPIGEQVVFSNIVPEFGTVAMMILAVAIISIVAVTAKSKVIPRF